MTKLNYSTLQTSTDDDLMRFISVGYHQTIVRVQLFSCLLLVQETEIAMKNISCKKAFFSAACCAALFMTAQSQAQNAGVSVQFGQPGFYGHVDLGNFPQPELVYRQPRIVQRGDVVQPPLYLVVPPGHRNRWDKNCYRYDACNRQVYFVQERWYNNRVVPRYRDGYYRDDDRDHDGRRDDRGHGRGRDYGHGH